MCKSSVFQPFQGLVQESLGVDLHLVAQLSRRREVFDPDRCDALKTKDACKALTDTEVQGMGLLVSFDGGSLLDKLLGIVPD